MERVALGHGIAMICSFHLLLLLLLWKPDFIDIIEQKILRWYGHVKRMPEERIPKLIMDWIPRERRKRERLSSHDNKKFRTSSMEKRRGMAFGFRKTETAIKKPDR